MEADRTLRVRAKVENVAQAYLELLSLRGVEYFFANSGTGFASIEDAFVRRFQQEKKTPKPLLIPHEITVMSMAYGYYQVTGKVQAAMVHVGVGTANALGVLMNASRGRIPILLSADRTPVTEEGNPASRNRYIHWGQEYFDQAGMVREFVKWDYELREPSHLETVVDRALTIAMMEPKGPVYLVLPREILAMPLDEVEFHTKRRCDIPIFYADPEKIQEAADLLICAEFPLIITSAVGRTPEAVRAMMNLSEIGAIGVISFNPEYMNFPTDHPYHLGFSPDPFLEKVDVILILECDVPWYPNILEPKDSTIVIQAGIDPLYSRYPIRSFPSDVTLRGETVHMLSALAQAMAEHPERDQEAIEVRSKKFKKMHNAFYQSSGQRAQRKASDKPLDFEWVSYNVNRILEGDSILVNEYDMRLSQLRSKLAGTYFSMSHAGYLGWGVGAALGMKLASPDRTVIATVGDGSYMFSVPSACHFVASTFNLPILIIVYNNRGYNACKMGTRHVHPDGWATKANQFPLSELQATADYEKICEAYGGYGERVEDPDQVGPALERALRVVKTENRQALLNMICK